MFFPLYHLQRENHKQKLFNKENISKILSTFAIGLGKLSSKTKEKKHYAHSFLET